eukprot:TRINITY_DN24219_c0_g1_i1.p1 TRINITY_DN24219_c0_g1~~TRINITY_DN24219_c0_g1_i1.p1  ORF type:complete len:228 (+),score=40.91 TRINITY_DN24219_c0_g1_i1:90-773(+)
MPSEWLRHASVLSVAALAAVWYFHSDEDSGETFGAHGPLPRGVPVYSLEELKAYDGRPESGRNGWSFLAVLGRVFNVTSAPEFYAPGSGYHVFAGYDCSRAFALTKTKAKLRNKGLEKLKWEQLDTLNNTYWNTYVHKYPIVGVLSDPPYDPSDFDHFAGYFDEVKVSAAVQTGSTGTKRRESKCPFTRAVRFGVNAVTSILPRLLLGTGASSTASADGDEAGAKSN